MSSSSCSVPHVSGLLSSLLAAEKEPTRVWLREEMDRTVDPRLHSIFQRLTNKFGNADWNREGSGGDSGQANLSDHVETDNHQTHQISSIPSTSTYYPESFQQHSASYEPENDPEILAQVKREIKEEEYELAVKNVMDNTQQTNEQIEDCVAVGEEEGREEMCDQVGHLFHQVNSSSSSTEDHHLLHNTNGDGLVSNQPIDDDHLPNGQVEEGEYNDGCDYEEGKEVEDDDTEMDSDNQHEESSQSVENVQIETLSQHSRQSQIIIRQSSRIAKRKQAKEEQTNETDNQETEKEGDDEQEEVTPPPVKRPRRFRSTTLSSTKQKQIITLKLQCPQCGLMFAQDKFNAHLKVKHSIGPYRCPVKDCRQSFDNKRFIGDHLAQSHQSTSQWNCDKCDHHFTSYKLLSDHNSQHHQLGLFQCAYPACTFTGEYKQKVANHYKQHKKTFMCSHTGCHFRTSQSYNLIAHERVHSGIKPFRCKWSTCDYTSTNRGNTIRHIELKHFKGKSTSNVRFDDYFEENQNEELEKVNSQSVKRPRTFRPTTSSSSKQKHANPKSMIMY